MSAKTAKRLGSESAAAQKLLILAQILALITLVFGLQFLLETTGGTLFLFATIGPLLLTVVSALLIGVGVYEFRRRHSLFASQTFEAGQVIFRQGDEGDCAYFIRSGSVEVLQKLGDEAETVVTKLSNGQYFGEMALIRNAPRNATVRAAAHTELAVLGKQNFLTMLNLIPSTQQDIMKTVNERAMNRGGQ
jgi:cyclic nucleotide-binding protein